MNVTSICCAEPISGPVTLCHNYGVTDILSDTQLKWLLDTNLFMQEVVLA